MYLSVLYIGGLNSMQKTWNRSKVSLQVRLSNTTARTSGAKYLSSSVATVPTEFGKLLGKRKKQDLLDEMVHIGFQCDGCGMVPIVGPRWRCCDCLPEEFDLCELCHHKGITTNVHIQSHNLISEMPDGAKNIEQQTLAAQQE
ncbi:hypothetical protein BC829DRAFT_7037 [Chytridium lagenaria]|nr:hypothetical protein BC829DRAFT_7037 [Chytridium lagenaria]